MNVVALPTLQFIDGILYHLYHHLYQYICDFLSKNRPSSHHKLKYFFSVQLVAILNCYHYTMHSMAPVERTERMTSTWDRTLDHG